MKTTVEVPDDLYRDAKVEAARRGTSVKELIEQGLRNVLGRSLQERRAPGLAALMKRARGAIDSGVPDLGSNPEHLADFGRDARGNR